MTSNDVILAYMTDITLDHLTSFEVIIDHIRSYDVRTLVPILHCIRRFGFEMLHLYQISLFELPLSFSMLIIK